MVVPTFRDFGLWKGIHTLDAGTLYKVKFQNGAKSFQKSTFIDFFWLQTTNLRGILERKLRICGNHKINEITKCGDPPWISSILGIFEKKSSPYFWHFSNVKTKKHICSDFVALLEYLKFMFISVGWSKY